MRQRGQKVRCAPPPIPPQRGAAHWRTARAVVRQCLRWRTLARYGAHWRNNNMENYINCRQCHNVFFADEEWKKICLKCWIKQKKKREEKLKGAREARYYTPPPKHNASNELKEMLPLLIRLCHPDRHNNSESSTKVTQWLLKQRNNS
jgi:hypothetical protein